MSDRVFVCHYTDAIRVDVFTIAAGWASRQQRGTAGSRGHCMSTALRRPVRAQTPHGRRTPHGARHAATSYARLTALSIELTTGQWVALGGGGVRTAILPCVTRRRPARSGTGDFTHDPLIAMDDVISKKFRHCPAYQSEAAAV